MKRRDKWPSRDVSLTQNCATNWPRQSWVRSWTMRKLFNWRQQDTLYKLKQVLMALQWRWSTFSWGLQQSRWPGQQVQRCDNAPQQRLGICWLRASDNTIDTGKTWTQARLYGYTTGETGVLWYRIKQTKKRMRKRQRFSQKKYQRVGQSHVWIRWYQ